MIVFEYSTKFEYYNEYAYLIKVIHFEKSIIAFYRHRYEFVLKEYYDEIKDKYNKEVLQDIKK